MALASNLERKYYAANGVGQANKLIGCVGVRVVLREMAGDGSEADFNRKTEMPLLQAHPVIN